MESRYDYAAAEPEILKRWDKAKAFAAPTAQAAKKAKQKPFTIIMPPPNANDPLHIGHAMFVTLEDVFIRFHRMKGDATLWLPGTDHAGIETQFVFEKKLAKEGKSRFDFDRETLFKKIWDYVQENSGVAQEQMKRLGASADWDRFKFTLNPEVVEFVLDTFLKLHHDKLVYRGQRLVNYCTKCGTGYSELEVEHEDRTDPLFYIRYRLANQPDKFVVVATTRPEPIWADTHLAVHPKDKKNAALIGEKLLNPLTNEPMEVIGDKFVDPAFGTGIVKLTPAHDFADYEVAQKHDLPLISAIDLNGRMTGGPALGKKVAEARKLTLELLQEKGLVERVDEKYQHRVGTCYRCHSLIEPLLLPQFFVSVAPLTKKALAALDKKEVVVLGAGREKILRHWLKNLKDWNISRQIVWGIRLPVWYQVSKNPQLHVTFVNKQGELISGSLSALLKDYSLNLIKSGLQKIIAHQEAPFVVSKTSPGEDYLQETDTFDTWFSSGQWPVVTLKTGVKGDFEYYYPTDVMETAYDILALWVMRMMLMGLYLTGIVPFRTVYLHGLIRDEQGRKMSKSIGNVINPLTVIDKYGADALRFALVMSSTPGADKNVGEGQIRGMRNFTNKIWNSARFVSLAKETRGSDDPAFFEKLNQTVAEVSRLLEELKPGLAAETVYNQFWHWFCDECIEKNKQGEISTKAIKLGLETFLKLLHPFVPFVTEAVWQELGHKDLLAVASWPQTDAKLKQ